MATAQEQASKFETTPYRARCQIRQDRDRRQADVHRELRRRRVQLQPPSHQRAVRRRRGKRQLATSTVVSIPAEKVAQALICCNKCNMRFRWIKLYIDDDNDLIAETDGIIAGDTVGDECLELLYRMVSICDDCYGTS